MLNDDPVPGTDAGAVRRQSRAILIALLFPTMAIVLGNSMFSIALPTIRDDFGLTTDVAAWLQIAFTLPFMMFMPLYGRLGDELGRSRLLSIGIALFVVGAALAFLATDLRLLFIGRLTLGAGAAGVTPLSIAIIMQRFLPSEHGRTLGVWNSIAPASSIFAPLLGGYLVDEFSWPTIFLPPLAIGVVALLVVRWQVPTWRAQSNWAVLRNFDWAGTALFAGTVVLLVLYVSSQAVTGVAPLRDWRLLAGTLLFGVAFTRWERRRLAPLVDLALLRVKSFRHASLISAVRMAMMIGIGFLIPLYLTDVYGLTASTIGLLAGGHSLSLFVSIRGGGPLADRWPNHRIMLISLSLQIASMLYFALLPPGRPLPLIAAGMMLHGLGAGLALAAYHRTALADVPGAQSGAAAGLYSMARFAGAMLATAVAGIVVQGALDGGLAPLAAYQRAFWLLGAVGFLGWLMATRLRDQPGVAAA